MHGTGVEIKNKKHKILYNCFNVLLLCVMVEGSLNRKYICGTATDGELLFVSPDDHFSITSAINRR